jgi:hypothetical protein
MLKIYCNRDYEVYIDVGLQLVMAPGGEQEARPRCHPLLLAVQDFTVITIGDGSGERSRSSPMKSPVPLGVARFSKASFALLLTLGC